MLFIGGLSVELTAGGLPLLAAALGGPSSVSVQNWRALSLKQRLLRRRRLRGHWAVDPKLLLRVYQPDQVPGGHHQLG